MVRLGEPGELRRQQHGAFQLNEAINNSFDILRVILLGKPFRQAVIREIHPQRTLVAPDAAFEVGEGTG